MRASLFASATVTSRTGRRASTPRTHRPALLSQRVARQTMEVAPSTSSLRISALPAFVIPPKRVLPPVECCRGTRPSQAAKCRALLKAPMWSPTVAAIREAVIRPDAGDRGQAPCGRVLARVAHDLLLERRHALGHRSAVRVQLRHGLPARRRDALLGADQGHELLEP